MKRSAGWLFPLLAASLACKSMIPPKDVPQNPAVKHAPSESYQKNIDDNAERMIKEGRETFRYDTFGSEAFWGDKLRLHEAIARACADVGRPRRRTSIPAWP